MTTGPRNTPHPIILHVDESNNPVRLAEASSIYVTSATIVSATITTLSATNYLGLNFDNVGLPGGTADGQIQFRKSETQFGGDSGLSYNEADSKLNVSILQANVISSTYGATLAGVTNANQFSSISLSAVSSRIVTLSATTISAITVCATNYNSLFDTLSFTNLDTRYLNSSGDSVTGSFYLQNLSAAIFSATTYLNLPSGAAVWNASALAGRPVTSTAPGQYEVLVFNGNAWVPSGIGGVAGVGALPNGPENSIQFRLGSTFAGSSTVKYNTNISGLELINTSSINLSSTSIRATTVSSANYLNIPSGTAIWNANKVADITITKVSVGDWVAKDILALQTGSLQRTPIDTYAYWVYDQIKPTIHLELPQTNASALRGFAVTATTPETNNILRYTGSVWAPSSAIALTTISATNLGGTDIVGTRVNVTNLSAVTLSSTSLSSISARIVGLSATTISATNWQGLPSAVATWNASALQGGTILGATTPVNQLGFLSYNPNLNEYQAISLSSLGNNGNAVRGYGAASYLASANDNYFAINDVWQFLNDYPENKDVLVFSSLAYGALPRWTWQQASSLVPAVTPFGSPGQIQFKGTNNVFSSTPDLFYNESNKYLGVSNIYVDTGGTIDTPWITIRSGFYSYGGGTINGNLSSISYTIFGKDTSSTGSPAPTQNNQTITYDSGAQKWKPGFAIYQATSIPDNNDGKNGDIYFRYIP